jgi:Na+-transporting NADH:ubiquinone oxidoreductase subunit A
LVPEAFVGITPKVVVHEGDVVKAGDALFVNKAFPEEKFASPVSGTVTAIVRGERRKVLCVKVRADLNQQYVDFGIKNVDELTSEEVKKSLLDAGLFGYMNQLPYAIATNPSTTPKAIFVSALRDMPLAGNFEYELKGNEEAFQTGISALSKIAKVYLGVGKNQSNQTLLSAKNAEVNVFDGKCPAGNVGVQINHIDPVNKGEVVWTVDPSAVIFFGRLFLTGKVDLRKKVAVAGSEVKDPSYVEVLVGTPLKAVMRS